MPTTHSLPSTFSYNAPILPTANHKFNIPSTTPPVVTQVEHKRTLGSSIKEGFGFGLGNMFAQRLFGVPSQSAKYSNETNTPSSTATPPPPPSNKMSYQDCLKDMYESCLLTKSHEECKHYSPYEIGLYESSLHSGMHDKASYSKCMNDMYLECSKKNSSEACQKYKL
jgi:hypothetical protein